MVLYNESKSSCTLCLVDLVGLYNESKLIFMRTVFGGPGGAVQ